MTSGRNKYQSRQDRARIREVLMREWDPIGVAGVPEATDEYDSYVGTVYVMMMDHRASAEELAAYLFDVSTDDMGMKPSEHLAQRSKQAAKALISMRPEFETH